jgi:hypothetical protein
LILESAPERRDELENLWIKYSPTFARASDETGFKMSAKRLRQGQGHQRENVKRGERFLKMCDQVVIKTAVSL